MSSPVGHTLAGCLISFYKESTPNKIFVKPRSIIFYSIVANSPDLDFIPGFLVGAPNYYHHGISHSLGFGVAVSLLFAWLISRLESKHFFRETVFFYICFCSHLLLDLFSLDGRPPFGIPIFWPFSTQYFMIPILPPVKHSVLDHANFGEFFSDMFSIHNVYVIGLEMLLTVPLISLLFFRRSQWIKK